MLHDLARWAGGREIAFPQRKAAAVIGCSQSQVSRILKRIRGAGTIDVAAPYVSPGKARREGIKPRAQTYRYAGKIAGIQSPDIRSCILANSDCRRQETYAHKTHAKETNTKTLTENINTIHTQKHTHNTHTKHTD